MKDLFGGIEAGGTKFVCLAGRGPEEIVAEERFPTTTFAETIARATAFFRSLDQPVRAVGVGSFGPVDLNPSSPTYGYITATPKAGWSHVDFAGALHDGIQAPIHFDTDVNAAVLGEVLWGAGQNADPCIYLTIGTGIGGGVMTGGKLLHGLVHPEIGHMFLPHDTERDPFPGNCPFHGDCLEGLAAGPALRKRWGVPAETLPPDHPAWKLEAHYLALAAANLALVFSPQRIILGGGVMDQPGLIDEVQRRVQALLNGYVVSPAILEHIDEFIVRPALGNRAGSLGALALAIEAV